jgi:hypothetical protein
MRFVVAQFARNKGSLVKLFAGSPETIGRLNQIDDQIKSWMMSHQTLCLQVIRSWFLHNESIEPKHDLEKLIDQAATSDSVRSDLAWILEFPLTGRYRCRHLADIDLKKWLQYRVCDYFEAINFVTLAAHDGELPESILTLLSIIGKLCHSIKIRAFHSGELKNPNSWYGGFLVRVAENFTNHLEDYLPESIGATIKALDPTARFALSYIDILTRGLGVPLLESQNNHLPYQKDIDQSIASLKTFLETNHCADDFPSVVKLSDLHERPGIVGSHAVQESIIAYESLEMVNQFSKKHLFI